MCGGLPRRPHNGECETMQPAELCPVGIGCLLPQYPTEAGVKESSSTSRYEIPVSIIPAKKNGP
jgi:hypothetical protein